MNATDDIIDTVGNSVQSAVGMNSPEEQIASNLFLTIIFAWSSIGLVFTIFLAIITFVLMIIGVLRLIPAVDSLYPLS